MTDNGFDGFITSDGEKIPIDDAARLIPMAEEYLRDEKKLQEVLMSLGRHCFVTLRFAGAQAYFEKLYQLTDSVNDKAFCLLSIGQMKEKQGECESALGWYRKAFSLEPGIGEVWYLLHNNLGYCLNLFERHREAMEHCLAAITIEPNRHNAHKNLVWCPDDGFTMKDGPLGAGLGPPPGFQDCTLLARHRQSVRFFPHAPNDSTTGQYCQYITGTLH